MADTFGEADCSIITLGVGKDVKAEQKLQPTLPKACHFFGADPIRDVNEGLYQKIGTFFNVAVSGKTEVSLASILERGLALCGGLFSEEQHLHE